MATSLLILARALHFGSGLILVGVVAFRWLILLPAFAGESDETWQQFKSLGSRLQTMFLWSGLVLVLSGLALFWAVSAGMSDTPLTESLSGETLGTVFFQTQFGTVCQWRLGLTILMVLFMWKLTRAGWQAQRRQSWLEIVAAFTAIALVDSFAWTGHAAATGGANSFWRITADALHLLAAAIWPTGLLPFAMLLALASRIGAASILPPTLKAIERFSNVSLLTVGILIATGIVNSYFMVGRFQALLNTTYGQLLSVKLLLFGSMLGIAAYNRFRMVPLILTNGQTPNRDAEPTLIRSLRNFVLTEFGLAIAVVVVVSFLGVTPPPR